MPLLNLIDTVDGTHLREFKLFVWGWKIHSHGLSLECLNQMVFLKVNVNLFSTTELSKICAKYNPLVALNNLLCFYFADNYCFVCIILETQL